jgi:group II intron reverse transcriptase/maturase
MASDLTGIREKAGREPKLRFTSLYHHVSGVEALRESYVRVELDKAPGVDGMTKDEYGEQLQGNLENLSQRLGRQGYRPQPVRRVYIDKAGSRKKRPLGIPTVEDKIVQMAVTRVLSAIYEADFLACSYGYRPQRSCHEALGGLGRTIQQAKVNWIVEADIRGFFDHVNHEWLMKFLGVRVGDPRVLRLIEKMLKGGVMEDGIVRASEEGTPQGGILSPLLSNVYLHYVLDLWFERRFRAQCRGETYLFRYADDFVVCFQYRAEAERFLKELEARLRQFHLEVEPSKTQLLRFGRFAQQDAARDGKEVETFDFLGFTHYCGQTRAGDFKLQRRTAAKKMRAKLLEITGWLRRQRHQERAGTLLQSAKRRLQGHLNYFAVTDNSRQCEAFRYQFECALYKWLNRRSQRRSYTWEQFRSALNWVRWPRVRIQRSLDPCERVGLKPC